MLGGESMASSEAAALALDANQIAYKALFSCLPGARMHHTAHLVWFETGLPDHYFNGVLQARYDGDSLGQAVASVRDHFAARRLPFHWSVGASSLQIPDLGRHLSAQGIQHVEDEPGMALDLERLNDALTVAVDVAMEPVTTQAQLEEWITVWGCGAPPAIRRIWLAAYAGVPWGPDQSLRLYLARVEGEAVATSALFLAAGVASINWVVTLPQRRRQGIGTAMTLQTARSARVAGYRMAVLTASAEGIGVYRRLGFEECCTVSTYAWFPDPA